MKQRSKKNLHISPNNINNNPVLKEKWKCLYCNCVNKKSEVHCQGKNDDINKLIFTLNICRMQ